MIKNPKQRLFEMMNRVADMPVDISEAYLPEDTMNEIDLENDFKDMKYTCMNVEGLKEYLNKILDNNNLPIHKRSKHDLIIHNKVIQKTKEGEVDVQEFIDNITQEPPNMVTVGNAKMVKSTTEDFYTVTIGLPAFRGIVYDMEMKNFLVINTCPGAGSCVMSCYARKGNYVRLPNNFLKQTRILNLLLNNPERFKEKLKAEIKNITNSKDFRGKQMRFRWNDSGDFFTKKYFEVGRQIMSELKAEGYQVKPYAHTKIADIYNANRIPSDFTNLSLADSAPDFVVSFSVDANKGERDKVDLTNAKTSEIVVSEYFNDLFVKTDPVHYAVDEKEKLIFKDKVQGMNILKQRIAKNFNIPNDETLLSHDELMTKPLADKPIYNVIIQSKGETDIPTQRHDVMRTFFLIH